jgi:hypothetical protein
LTGSSFEGKVNVESLMYDSDEPPANLLTLVFFFFFFARSERPGVDGFQEIRGRRNVNLFPARANARTQSGVCRKLSKTNSSLTWRDFAFSLSARALVSLKVVERG